MWYRTGEDVYRRAISPEDENHNYAHPFARLVVETAFQKADEEEEKKKAHRPKDNKFRRSKQSS
jgi:hypothetical protein